jgi:hypothetical protein
LGLRLGVFRFPWCRFDIFAKAVGRSVSLNSQNFCIEHKFQLAFRALIIPDFPNETRSDSSHLPPTDDYLLFEGNEMEKKAAESEIERQRKYIILTCDKEDK